MDRPPPVGPPPEAFGDASPASRDDMDADIDVDMVEEDLEDHGNSLPNPEQVKGDHVPTSSPDGGDCWTAVLFIVLILLMTATIIGLSVGLTADNRAEKKNSNNNNNDDGFSGNDFSADTIEKRKAQFKSYFIENGINDEADFVDPLGPRSKAIDFLAEDDQRRLAIPNTGLASDEGYAALTRYVMTIIYYANNGKSWDYDMLFVSSHDTCEWFELFPGSLGQVGVLCDETSRKIAGLSFINNKLEGTLPKEIGHLTTINYLESIQNDLTGGLPAEFAKLTGLETLVMAGGQFSGQLPAWLSGMPNLEFLYLSNNNFSGQIPNTWSNMGQMSVLALDDNALTGNLDVVWQLTKLEYLYLEDNDFKGELPASISTTLPFLVNFDASTNDLGGNLPDDLFRLSNLQILDLSGNSFGGPLPSNIAENERLLFIALFDNDLTGDIPQAMGNLAKVTHLDLAGNLLQGAIPTTLQKMTNMEYLFLSNNPLAKGSIPAFMYDYDNLQELSLKNTKREGGLSHLVSFWDKLILLDLDNNELSGSIPSQVGEMEKLQFLLLNRNAFTGDVPVELGDLPDLRVFMLDRNDLSGNVQAACDIPTIQLAIADCDEVACYCCNPCCTDGEDCHDMELATNISPAWEIQYQRQFFDFSHEPGAFNVGDDDVLANMGNP